MVVPFLRFRFVTQRSFVSAWLDHLVFAPLLSLLGVCVQVQATELKQTVTDLESEIDRAKTALAKSEQTNAEQRAAIEKADKEKQANAAALKTAQVCGRCLLILLLSS